MVIGFVITSSPDELQERLSKNSWMRQTGFVYCHARSKPLPSLRS